MFRLTRRAHFTLPVVALAAAGLAACGGSGHATGSASSPQPGASSSASASPGSTALTKETATTLVSRAVLGNEDLGPKWSGSLIPGGATLDDPTLDVCEESFESDKSRIARNQTVLSSSTAELSNEVVAYKSGGAKKALEELTNVVNACKNKTTVTDGHTLRMTADIVPGHAAWGAGALAVRQTYVDLTDGTDSGSFLAVYQVQGDVLSAVYEGAGNVSQDLLFQVADLAATRLSQALTNTPRSTASIPVPSGTPIDPRGQGGQNSAPGQLA